MSLVLAFLAGLLTSLSPCVIPLLPLVVGSASSRHRLGPVALCTGLTLSFSVFAVAVALATQAFNFDPGTIRIAGAVLLLLLGVISLLPPAQEWTSRLLAPLASRASIAAASEERSGLLGNFFVGSLLGAIWSPCAGPTLGAAIGLAAGARTALYGFVLMVVFGLGASLPLLVVAYGSRSFFQTKRRWLIAVSTKAKPVFGMILILVATGILIGWDKKFETAVLNHLPQGWIDLTTRY